MKVDGPDGLQKMDLTSQQGVNKGPPKTKPNEFTSKKWKSISIFNETTTSLTLLEQSPLLQVQGVSKKRKGASLDGCSHGSAAKHA